MQQRNSPSVQSFLLGLVVGVLVTLLFTTKKGRQILRSFTEESLNKFSEVEDILHAIEDDEDMSEVYDDEYVESGESERPAKMVVEEDAPRVRSHALRRLTNGRKFFRRPARKS